MNAIAPEGLAVHVPLLNVMAKSKHTYKKE
jgi:hypothetical protein